MLSLRFQVLSPIGATLLAFFVLFVPGVAAQDVQSPELAPEASFSHTFDSAGMFGYHDHLASTHWGEITIMAQEDDPPATHDVAVHDGSPHFVPRYLTVQLGDTVRWTNMGDQDHKVMGWYNSTKGDGHDHAHDDGDTAESPGMVWAAPLLAAVALGRLRSRGGSTGKNGHDVGAGTGRVLFPSGNQKL